MNYEKIYESFITDRLHKNKSWLKGSLLQNLGYKSSSKVRLFLRSRVGYVECHHILPKSKGGKDDNSNIVYLTAEDHIHAHILLGKIYGGAMWHCIHYISGKYNNAHPNTLSKRIISKVAFSRRHSARESSIRMRGANNPAKQDWVRRKISKSLSGKPLSEITKLKLSKRSKGNSYAKGNVMSDACKLKLAQRCKGNSYAKGTIMTDSNKTKLITRLKGNTYSKGVIQKPESNLERSNSMKSFRQTYNDPQSKSVLCVETNEVFASKKLAARTYSIHPKSITLSIKEGRKIKKINKTFIHQRHIATNGAII